MPPRHVVSADAARRAWLEGIVDAWACYLADLLALRCSFFVRKGGLVRWVGEDPPVYDDSQPRCHACQAPLTRRQVLCRACRRQSPVVEEGPTMSEVMLRSSSDEYVLDDTKKQVIQALRKQQRLAFDAALLANTMRTWCCEEHDDLRRSVEGATGNVSFDRAFVNHGGSYDYSVLCGLAESLVPVGGIGADLRDEVATLAEQWLMAIDRQIRDWFGIPVSSDAVEGAVVHQHIKNFAGQIANRVALLEPVPWRGANKSAVLCVDALEHHAKSQYVHQELIANENCEVDCECMAVLARLARHGINSNEQWRALATPQMRKPLTDLLQSPPPELLQCLLSVAQDMGFSTLRDVIGNASEAGRLATQAGINEWRSSINVEVLCGFFGQAIKKIEKWERPAGYFIETISRLPRATSEATRAQLRLDPRAVLPPTPWARGRGQWQLVSREKLEKMRTGLRPTGLRIVMLCSALRQLLGTREDEPEVFAPGVVAYDVLYPVTDSALKTSERACSKLKGLMTPLMAGFECAVVKHQLNNWAGSHLEDDVRAAARRVGRYSLQELVAVFGVDSAHWDGHSLQLVRKVNDRLVFKLQGQPSDAQNGVVSQVLAFALPLLQQYRLNGLGWSLSTRTTDAAMLLELLPSVQQWISDGSEQPLLLTRAEVLATSEGVKRLLERLKASGLVRMCRATMTNGKQNNVWRFEPAPLAALLAPAAR